MESIQHNFYGRNINFFYKLSAFCTGIDKISLKTIQYFKAIINTTFGCNLSYCADIFDTSLPVSGFINRLAIVNWSVRIDASTQSMNIKKFQLFKNISIKCNCIVHNCRIRTSKILTGIWTISGC